jgi:hypothetical protein
MLAYREKGNTELRDSGETLDVGFVDNLDFVNCKSAEGIDAAKRLLCLLAHSRRLIFRRTQVDLQFIAIWSCILLCRRSVVNPFCRRRARRRKRQGIQFRGEIVGRCRLEDIVLGFDDDFLGFCGRRGHGMGGWWIEFDGRELRFGGCCGGHGQQ